MSRKKRKDRGTTSRAGKTRLERQKSRKMRRKGRSHQMQQSRR